jgi:TonB family protein
MSRQAAAGLGAALLLMSGAAGAGKLYILHAVNPAYPEAARAEQAIGCVLLKFEVRPDGTVGGVMVEKSNPAGLFDAAAIDAARQMKFLAFAPPAVVVTRLYTFSPSATATEPVLVKLPDDAIVGPADGCLPRKKKGK